MSKWSQCMNETNIELILRFTLKVVNLSEGLASMIITLIYKLLSIKLENVNVKCRAILFFKAIAL